MTGALKENWVPSDGVQLDENAISIVQSNENSSILAGPGAGKTELLAQRASFLLETGTCRSPSRILAITFKVDAARNLQDRVEKRCSEELAQRFDAMTLDAFAKRILDQFREALPEELRPSPNYTIFFPNRDIWNDFTQRYGETYASLNRKKHKALERLVHLDLPCLKSDEVESEDDGIRQRTYKGLHISSSL